MINIDIERFAHTKYGTFGALTAKRSDSEHFRCYTLERRWLENERNVSCIPDGTYDLAMRKSSVVKRSSGGQYKEGWEVLSVPNRTWIMIHPGNIMTDSQGCIMVGHDLGRLKNQWAITESRQTFCQFMQFMQYAGPHTLNISWWVAPKLPGLHLVHKGVRRGI